MVNIYRTFSRQKIDERWLSREQLFADNHGVRNHRRRLIDHELVGQSAAVCIFGVAGGFFFEWVETSLQNLFGIRKHHDAGPDIGKRAAFSRPSRRIGGFCFGRTPQLGSSTPERFNTTPQTSDQPGPRKLFPWVTGRTKV